MLVLGLDPGLAITGYGLVRESSNGDLALVEYGAITTYAGQPMPDRLLAIDRELETLLLRYRPEVVAIEELFFCKNVTTALAVGQARGVAILGIARSGVPLYEYKPMVIKQAITGYGKAPKSQVQEMVRLLLNLAQVPQPDDAADGVAVAICHLYNVRLNSLVSAQSP
ncbi:MAG: crossover junction endodeoxyribonuclease RuvC [Chloroflexi bacterium]|jgi:crossover junction endodeoxyribonuclease RuvC|nr:crossover junction endodeoxyribonuclease RuvC [Chloroflexota bacterium]MBL7199776.1 crossover junction endodeoxyribonuclease RuvC [Anaerolineae bacterium]